MGTRTQKPRTPAEFAASFEQRLAKLRRTRPERLEKAAVRAARERIERHAAEHPAHDDREPIHIRFDCAGRERTDDERAELRRIHEALERLEVEQYNSQHDATGNEPGRRDYLKFPPCEGYDAHLPEVDPELRQSRNIWLRFGERTFERELLRRR